MRRRHLSGPRAHCRYYLKFAVAWVALGIFPGLGAAEAPGVFGVRQAGAVPDGKTLCTAAIQSTIDRCAQAGGGTVYFPAGTYLTGALVLRSHTTLHLEAGATLLGSPDPKDYPHHQPAIRSYTDNYVRQALLYGENLERVTLRGEGTIDGNGAAFKWKEYRDRPFVIRMINCRDVVVEGLTLRASPMWMQHYLACDRLRFHGLRIFNHVSYNNDGLDLDGCHDVRVSDCAIDSDDDALVLKSTIDRACENVTVTNCVLSSHANAFKLGTESNGGFKRITFSNSVILSPRFSQAMYGMPRGGGGIALEMVDGGALENVAISNISITGVNVPLFLRLGHRARPIHADAPKPGWGTFRNVTIDNIVATGTGRVGCSITGLPDHPVENVSLSNLTLEFDGGGQRELVNREVPEKPEAYPESRMFGELPAFGLYCLHVRGLKITGLRMSTREPDARHALVCDDVRELEIAGLTAPASEVAPVRFTNVADAMISGARPRAGGGAFLKLDGAATRDIALVGNDFTRLPRGVERAAEVSAAACTER